MKTRPVVILAGLALPFLVSAVGQVTTEKSATRQPLTLYVSQAGDNTDGRSWRTAFQTIQAALDAIPDDLGGHRVIIRPGTYAEANLDSKHKGAARAYNVIEGDWDGSKGSGATGWVVIDSGAPRVVVRTNPKAPTGNPTFMILPGGDPDKETGLKSVDWWGPWRCDPAYSAAGWDRWLFRRLYCTGSEGGIGWDMTCQAGVEFSAVVEDCVGLGRFAGGCVIAYVGRAGEPVVFRRCFFVCLDVWGDAGAVYLRAHNKTMPATPDAVFEDCTLVGPDNALQVGYPGFEGYTRVLFKDSRLLVLNFSQPHGTPATGAVYSDLAGKYLHVDFENCTVMGYKALGARSNEVFSYTTKGTNRAYVQYRQPVPEGFERLRFWPVEVFNELTPPRFQPPAAGGTSPAKPRLTKIPVALGPQGMENTPVVFNGRPLLVLNHRDDTKNKTDEYKRSMYLNILDLATGREVARFGEGHSFANAFANGPELSVFASEGTDRDWFQSLYRFSTSDLKTWKRELAIPQAPGEHLFNASVCRDEQGFVMAYESDKPVQFCFKFARSTDLAGWKKLEGLAYKGVGGEYSACPVMRYLAPYYYVIYLHAAVAGHNGWISFLARSRDLVAWELSPLNPILEAGPGEGVNNSDVDLFEYEGNTYLFYATGDQQTWGTVRLAMFPGPMRDFFSSYFPEGTATVKVSTR
jgi:hypothetical protein